MSEKVLYCEECQDIVPEEDTKDFFKNGHVVHTYTHMVNAYKNQRPGMIGFCAVDERVFCGKVREPTPEEYFIHYTCNSTPLKRKPPKKFGGF